MKYKEDIVAVFKEIGLEPRDVQINVINQALEALIDNGYKYLALNVPTGGGKSLIGIVLSVILEAYAGTSDDDDDNSESYTKAYITMHNNTLVNQYEDSLRKTNLSYINVKGSANYFCNVTKETAESCCYKKLYQSQDERLSMCKSCHFLQMKRTMYSKKIIVTNYSYFLLNSGLPKRLITIYDEAQLFNDIFVDFFSNAFSKVKLEKYISDFGDRAELKEFKDALQSIVTDIDNKAITEFNIGSYINRLGTIFLRLSGYYEAESELMNLTHDLDKYAKLKKIAKKYANIALRLNELEDDSEIDIVKDVSYEQDKFEVKPVFMGKLFSEKIDRSKYHVFMSATIDPEYLSTVLSIDKKEICFVKTPPVFDISNKKVFFFNLTKYNYENMAKQTTIDNMNEYVGKVVKKHSSESGIILTPSFKLSKQIEDSLRKFIRENKLDVQIVAQQQGEHFSLSLEKFKSMKKNAVLISPSMFEGVDLPDDLSRYQIMLKAPFASLADKRIKFIASKYPTIYRINTLYKVLQGFGRSVRHFDDFANTYCFDSSIYDLFLSKLNHWKDEFQTNVVK